MKTEKITKEEFEKKYAEKSGMTIERLKELGGHGEPCNCEEEGCKGWKMIFDDKKMTEKELRYSCSNDYTYIITPPPMNFILQMGEIEKGLRFEFYVKKTVINRLKYWLFCRFFPFKIIKWGD